LLILAYYVKIKSIITTNNTPPESFMPSDEAWRSAAMPEYNLAEMGLERVSYLAGLRTDLNAPTYIDKENRLYLRPLADHDYEASHHLKSAGLSIAEMVSIPNPDNPSESLGPLFRYGAEADFVTLSAVLNSSVDVPDALEDVLGCLVKVGEFMKTAKEICDFLPYYAPISSWAIDRNTGKVELLPPFNPSASTVTPKEKYMQLLNEVSARAVNQSEQNKADIDGVLNDSLRQIIW
jgi:hypothetical protein